MDSVFSNAYTEEQLEEVRKALRHQLRHLGADSVISQLVSELQLQSASDITPVQADQALQLLHDRGIVEQIAASVTAPPHLLARTVTGQLLQDATQQPAQPTAQDLKSGQQYLQVKLLGARAVMDYVARNPLPGEVLQLSVELFGHRLVSEWVPAGPEPGFSGEIFIPLPKGSVGKVKGGKDKPASEQLALLTQRQPLHLVLTSSTPTRLEPASDTIAAVPGSDTPHDPWPDLSYSCSACSVVAMGAGDWRTCLLRTRPVVVCVQMGGGPGMALGVPGGAAPACVVNLQLCLHPRPPAAVEEAVLQTQQRNEASRDAQCVASFVQRAKAWWAQYAHKSPDFRTRPVKVLARCEDGTQRPSCSFVRPLQLSRALPTAHHAARWVSLLRHRDLDSDLGTQGTGTALAGGPSGLSTECWCTLHTCLASRSASSEEAALLLCSLLLGFGLDAYVAVGRKRNGEGCLWVISRAAFAQVTHWDPCTGTSYSSVDMASCPYHTIGSLFNHQRVYANCQGEEVVTGVSFLLEEPSLWHDLEVHPADVPGPLWSTLSLPSPTTTLDTLEPLLEQQIKAVLANHLTTLQPPTWDVALEHMLMPALEAYEFEAVTGTIAPGQEDFHTAIKRDTPMGWEFKGVPQHHRHLNAAVMALSLLEDESALNILQAVQDQGGVGAGVVLALRVKVWPYPGGLFSCWVMLASKAPAQRNV